MQVEDHLFSLRREAIRKMVEFSKTPKVLKQRGKNPSLGLETWLLTVCVFCFTAVRHIEEEVVQLKSDKARATLLAAVRPRFGGLWGRFWNLKFPAFSDRQAPKSLRYERVVVGANYQPAIGDHATGVGESKG